MSKKKTNFVLRYNLANIMLWKLFLNKYWSLFLILRKKHLNNMLLVWYIISDNFKSTYTHTHLCASSDDVIVLRFLPRSGVLLACNYFSQRMNTSSNPHGMQYQLPGLSSPTCGKQTRYFLWFYDVLWLVSDSLSF